MDTVTQEEQTESISALQSAIRKSETALVQLTERGKSTTLLQKRLKALQIGVGVLESVWHAKAQLYSQEEVTQARQVLADLSNSIKSLDDRFAPGSAQHTLVTRRLRALELAVQAMDETR